MMTRYFRYVIQNTEPLRIANDSSSQSGQTVSLKYIPGTTVRGFVIHRLAGEKDFEKYKSVLFSVNVRYLNAFLYEGDRDCEDGVKRGKELLPSLKGFYEDKTSGDKHGKKEIENGVVKGGDIKNNKKADLAHYCAIKDDCIYFYEVESASDMKIKIGKEKEQKVFRNEYIRAGYQFVGYIALDDTEYSDRIEQMLKEVFQGEIYLGNGRSQGLGKCIVKDAGMEQMKAFPYREYCVEAAQKEVYMMLLSNTVMRNPYGEYCGLDLKWLQERFRVEKLQIAYCSSSVVEVRGYNRAWKGKTPSVTMYEQGSVFHLTFDGRVSEETLRELMHAGIGIRKNEGFGRILFLDPAQYKNIKYKVKGEIPLDALDADKMLDLPQNQQVLKRVAKKYYKFLLAEGMRERMLSGVNAAKLPNSQLGTVRALLEKNQYRGKEGVEEIKRYFDHIRTKEENQRTHNERKSMKPFITQITKCLDNSLNSLAGIGHLQKIMGIGVDKLLTEQEEIQMKCQYLLDLFRYENRGGNQ